jgi:hypothetical protein
MSADAGLGLQNLLLLQSILDIGFDVIDFLLTILTELYEGGQQDSTVILPVPPTAVSGFLRCNLLKASNPLVRSQRWHVNSLVGLPVHSRHRGDRALV